MNAKFLNINKIIIIYTNNLLEYIIIAKFIFSSFFRSQHIYELICYVCVFINMIEIASHFNLLGKKSQMKTFSLPPILKRAVGSRRIIGYVVPCQQRHRSCKRDRTPVTQLYYLSN